MPRYRSKPRVIEAVQFDPSMLPEEALVAVREGRWAVWNKLHEGWINLKPGDYIRIDDPNDNYPIDEAIFAATYNLITEEDTDGKKDVRVPTVTS